MTGEDERPGAPDAAAAAAPAGELDLETGEGPLPEPTAPGSAAPLDVDAGVVAIAVAEPPPLPAAADRPIELRLAAIHLRTGVLALARAELETSAGRGELDDAALLDLAEVRWRTDDVTGAGEAAAAFFATGREDTLALVIATEATAAIGRSTEARRLAARALARGDVDLDAIFSGIRPSSYWPSTSAMAGVPAGTLFGGPPPGSTVGTAGVSGAAVLDRLAAGTPAAPRAVPPPAAGPAEVAAAGSRPAGSPGEPGQLGQRIAADQAMPTLWPDAETLPAGHGPDSAGRLPEPSDALAAAGADLAEGRPADAAVRLAVVLRLSPGLAPAVLEVLAEATGPSLELVRGDALRMIGRESDARRAYAAAAAQLAGPPGASPDG